MHNSSPRAMTPSPLTRRDLCDVRGIDVRGRSPAANSGTADSRSGSESLDNEGRRANRDPSESRQPGVPRHKLLAVTFGPEEGGCYYCTRRTCRCGWCPTKKSFRTPESQRRLPDEGLRRWAMYTQYGTDPKSSGRFWGNKATWDREWERYIQKKEQ